MEASFKHPERSCELHTTGLFSREKKRSFCGTCSWQNMSFDIDSNLQAGQTRRYAIKYSGYIRIPLKEMNSRKRRTAAPRFTTSVWYEKVGEAPVMQRSTVGGPINIRRAPIGDAWKGRVNKAKNICQKF